MSDWQLRTPVAFLIFNRPDTTARVFAEIAKAKPPKLLVVADGPRETRPDEAHKCAQTRAIIESVDWPCEVMTNYSDVNLGCRSRVSSGLDWVFQQVPEAIILEDDCVPHFTFFRYCEELLERYRNDERIGMICGDNFQFGKKIGDGSYYFSKYTPIWGWATWRRAWLHYDVTARAWPKLRESGALKDLTFPCERQAWISAFEGVYAKEIDTWDYQWTLSCWAQSMITVMPQVNLVTNIGFGPEATHTRTDSLYSNISSEGICWPLIEPSIVRTSSQADKKTADDVFTKSIYKRAILRIRRLMSL